MKRVPHILFLMLLAACSSGSGAGVDEGYSPVPAVSPAPADKAITGFTVTGARGTVNRIDRTVKLYLPVGTDLSALAPTITLASGYTISPVSGVSQDFATAADNTIDYTVTNPDQSTTTYQVQAINTATSAATVDTWLGRGINLGNDLDANSVQGPVADEEGLWTGGVKAREYFFDDYKALGFDSVRIPITWNRRLSQTGPNYPVDADFMTRVDTVAGWGIDRGLTVVINAHHEDWIRTKTGSDFTNALPRFKALWTQIADHFKDWPPQLVFEILNEPQGSITAAEVNTLNSAILGIIRASGGNNATRAVIIGANQYNSLYALIDSSFTIPSDSYLIANFHDYNPWTFAGESQGTWGSGSDIQAATNDLNSVVTWSQNHSNIPLYLGEFGAAHQANGNKTDPVSRVAWYTNMSSLAHDRSIPAAAWDDYGDYKLYDRVNRTFETAIKTALLGD